MTTKNLLTVLFAGTGTLTTDSSISLSSSNQLLTITADDINFEGDQVSSGTAPMIINPATTARTLGLGVDTSGLFMTGAELAVVGTAEGSGGLTIGSLGASSSITVTGITKANSDGITGIVTMLATVDDSKITFATTPSTFHALAAQADNGVVGDVDLTATYGIMYLDGDYENSTTADTVDDVQFADDKTFSAETMMTLESTTGTLVPAGVLTLIAGSGLAILEDMTSAVANKPLVFDVDFESEGDGTLTVQTAKTITSNKSDVQITAWDIDLDGSLTTGTLAISIHGAKVSQTIGIGASLSQNMEILDGELGRLATEAGLTMGDITTGEIQLNGVTDTSSDAVGTITLVATKDATQIQFQDWSFCIQQGHCHASNGRSCALSKCDNKEPADSIICRHRHTKVELIMSLSSSNQLLTITADDINFLGDQVSSGTALMIINPATTARTLGLGVDTSGLFMTGAELAVVGTEEGSGGLTIGSLGASSSITVTGITEANSDGITGIVTMLATVDDSKITFATTPSTFHALAAQADNGVVGDVDLTATYGIMYLDGDYENSTTADTVDDVQFADDKTLSAETMMTLESTTGTLVPAGVLTLIAGSGVVILEDMTSAVANKPLVFDVDFESEGDGTLTVQTAKTITSNKSDVQITAWDIDLDGSLTTGTLAISIHGAKVSQTIGIGASLSQNMEILDGELGRLATEAGLTVGDITTGEIQLNGVTDTSSDAVGTITLVATKDATIIQFKTGASAFNKGIVMQAMGGVVLSASVTTKNLQTVLFAGTGTLTTDSSISLSSSNQLLAVTADDINFEGDQVSSGTAAMIINPAATARTLGLGVDTSGLFMTGAELAVVGTEEGSGGLTIGSLGASSSITVTGITKANSDGITGIVTMLATVDDSKITFATTPSTFHALAAQADNGVVGDVDLTATYGIMYLDGDYENSTTADTVDDVQFADDKTFSAETMMTLESTTGTLVPAGVLTLIAGSGLVILEDMTSAVANKPLVFDVDFESEGDGTLTVQTAKTITSNKSDVQITAWDIDLDGSLTAGTLAISIHGAK